MPNTIALAKNYTELLDEVYRSASATADLTSDSNLSRAGANANEIIYPQISVSGLGDYDRNSGYVTGAVDLKWKTAQFNYDRGTKISVDVMDNEESRNLAFGMAGATLMREKVAPEADAFTFATLAALENISKATGTVENATQFLDALLTAWSKMDEDEVPQENYQITEYYQFLARQSVVSKSERKEADEWLEELAYWIEDLTYYYSLPELNKNRQVTGVSITGSPYPMEANDKEAMYQILLSITYTRERREL